MGLKSSPAKPLINLIEICNGLVEWIRFRHERGLDAAILATLALLGHLKPPGSTDWPSARPELNAARFLASSEMECASGVPEKPAFGRPSFSGIAIPGAKPNTLLGY